MPQSQPWPAVYKIDAHHMVIGNSCLDPDTGQILWTSKDFSAGPVPIFNYGTYSPEEKMFYTRVNSYVQGWNFSDPSLPPTMSWQTYVAGSGIDGSGIQYGDGKVFPGSFESHQVALDAKTGAILWDTNTKDAMLFSGTYDNGKFFRGGAHDNTFYSFDATTGNILWTYSPGTADGYFCTGTAAAVRDGLRAKPRRKSLRLRRGHRQTRLEIHRTRPTNVPGQPNNCRRQSLRHHRTSPKLRRHKQQLRIRLPRRLHRASYLEITHRSICPQRIRSHSLRQPIPHPR